MNQDMLLSFLLAGIFFSGPAVAGFEEDRIDLVGKEVSAWFVDEEPGLSDLPNEFKNLENLSKHQVKMLAPAIWEGYAKSPVAESLLKSIPVPDLNIKGSQPQRHDLDLGEKTMPFYFFGREVSKKKRPLFIALHGGGSAGGSASSPHAWSVNTREWAAQAHLARLRYPAGALYFVPRMADDNDGRWYYNYCQDAYDKVVRAAILHHEVDPDRIYLIGISEGAYTAYRLGSFMADRWAGAGSMAGGEPINNAPPENMRNMAFRADIGERDTMFDRVGLNIRFGEALDELQKSDPKGYVHEISVQPGRGHGIDYRACPEWLFKHKRNPWPERVVWKVIDVHGRYKPQFYWLALDRKPSAPLYIDARINKAKQTVSLVVEQEGPDGQRMPAHDVSLRVYLNDELLNLDQPIRIVRNGKEIFNGSVARSGAVMLKSLAERGDPAYMFPAEVVVGSSSVHKR